VNKKKTAITALSVASVVAMSTAAHAAPAADHQAKAHSLKLDANGKTIVKGKAYGQNDKVRVIVELSSAPAITYAKAEGKKYADLSKTTQKSLQQKVSAQQKSIKANIKKNGVNVQYLGSFDTIFNGFSGNVKFGDIQKIEGLAGVAKVHVVNEYKRPTEKPDMITSKELVQAQQTWGDYGYKGEGMVVGVIDTGIDPSHHDMSLTTTKGEKLTKSVIDADIKKDQLKGKFYTDKVPYGYNYADNNDNILDEGPDASMHGMHVSGTVGANGDEKAGGIKGVAPEAQLLALKVFSNDPGNPSTYGDIYVKAIDDAIKLGADVLNMSLGSTASFVAEDDPEQQAITNAVNNGVFMSISAGNSAYFGHGYQTPYAANPDTGVVGAPGLTPSSLQVASLENSHIQLDSLTVNAEGEEPFKIGWQKQSAPNPLDVFHQEEKEVVYVGDGQPDKYEGKDVKGKIVFVTRDGGFFYSKIQKQAEEAGAAGVIVRGTVAHGDYVNMALENPKLPMASVSIKDGNALKALFEKGKTVKVSFNGSMVTIPNNTASQMSDFTSWGVTPNLDFKPEITAPGGKIYSTFNDNKYGVMSGTSMAAPHVAGGAALVLERVDKEFKPKHNADRVLLAKNLLMNTSAPVVDKSATNAAQKWTNFYSPRREGAGLMQLHAAVSTPVVVTEKTSGVGKVALKEITKDKVSFTLVAKNVSKRDVEYDVASSLQTDLVLKGKDGINHNEMEAQPLQGATVKVNNAATSKVKLKAGQSQTVNVTVDLTGAKVADPADLTKSLPADQVFPNGYFVDGFVRFVSTAGTDGDPTLTVPFVGFKGDWNKAPILDASIYDDNYFYGMEALIDKDENVLGASLAKENEYLKDKIAFSPNGDESQDEVIPQLTLLRNAKKLEFSITDKSGKVLRTLRTETDIPKNYYDGGSGDPAYVFKQAMWDGKLNNVVAKDGEYVYQVKAYLDYENKAPQVFKFPVKIDTKMPTLSASYDNGKLSFKAADAGVGVNAIDVLVDGKSVLKAPLSGDATSYVFETKPEAGQTVEVAALDYAGNAVSREVSLVKDTGKPSVFITAPGALDVVDKSQAIFSGYIQDESKIQSFTLNGQQVELKWNDEKKQFDFSHAMTFKDGVQVVKVAAEDLSGNVSKFERSIVVDATAPKLELQGKVPTSVGKNVKSAKLSVKLSDNYDEIRFRVNGSETYAHEFKEPYAMRPFAHTETINVPLTPGKNTFLLEVEDLAGHVTKKTVSITRASK